MNHQKKRSQLSLKGQDSLFLQRRLHKFGLCSNRSQDQRLVVSKKKISSLFRFSSNASPRGLKGEVSVRTEPAARFFSNLKEAFFSFLNFFETKIETQVKAKSEFFGLDGTSPRFFYKYSSTAILRRTHPIPSELGS